ncbi:MAG: extracellular solute-binding protein [Woeseiaceae bacterium]|nr:extracellular solute-binding protein [Woeseiaceae bacterium]
MTNYSLSTAGCFRPGVLALAALFLAAGCGSDESAGDDANVVNVYNWSDYIGPETIENFESEFGIQVNYDFYDSSEVVDVKLLAGNSGYDVVVHSAQFSSRLAPIGIYQELDFSRLPNARHLDPEILEQTQRYEETIGYNVPYMWGSTGYAWNEEMVRERLPDHPMNSSDVLFDPDVISRLADCGVSLLDGRRTFSPWCWRILGRDPNAVDEEALAAAEAQLMRIRPYVRYFSNSKMISDLPNREVCVAMSWSGDYAQAAARAEEAGIDIDPHYTVPRKARACGWMACTCRPMHRTRTMPTRS